MSLPGWNPKKKIKLRIVDGLTDEDLHDFPVPVHLSSNARTETVDDYFSGNDGDLPDERLWKNANPTEDISILNNKLHMLLEPNIGDNGLILSSVFRLSGDFDVQINYEDVSVHDNDSEMVYMVVKSVLDSTAYTFIGAGYYTGGVQYWTRLQQPGTACCNDTITARSNYSGILRIRRIEDQIDIYYIDDGNPTWTLVRTGTFCGHDVQIQLQGYRGNTAFGSEGYFYNFKVNSGEIVWPDDVPSGSGVTHKDLSNLFSDLVASSCVFRGRLYVAPNGADGGSGDAYHPYATLSHAVANASAGDTIVLYPGVYYETASIQLNKSLTITSLTGVYSDVVVHLPNIYHSAIQATSGGVFNIMYMTLVAHDGGGFYASTIYGNSRSDAVLQLVGVFYIYDAVDSTHIPIYHWNNAACYAHNCVFKGVSYATAWADAPTITFINTITNKRLGQDTVDGGNNCFPSSSHVNYDTYGELGIFNSVESAQLTSDSPCRLVGSQLPFHPHISYVNGDIGCHGLDFLQRNRIALEYADTGGRCFVEHEGWDAEGVSALLHVKSPKINGFSDDILYLYWDEDQRDQDVYPIENTPSISYDSPEPTLDGNLVGDFTLRQVMDSSLLQVSGSRIRIRVLYFNTVWGFAEAFIGHQAVAGDVYDFDGNQVRLTFGGQNGLSGIDGNTWSDWVDFDLDASRNLIISADMSPYDNGPALTISGSQGGWKAVAGEAGLTDVTGYTLDNYHYSFGHIEVFEENKQNLRDFGYLLADDFDQADGSLPDPNMWVDEHKLVDTVLEGGRLKLVNPITSETWVESGSELTYAHGLIGDFVLEVDLDASSLNADDTNSPQLNIILRNDLGDVFTLGWFYPAVPKFYCWSNNYNTEYTNYPPITHNVTCRARFTRRGNVITAEIRTGDFWHKAAKATMTSTPKDFLVSIACYSAGAGNTIENIGYADNFKVVSADAITGFMGDTGDVPAQLVWSNHYKAVYHVAQDPSGTAPQILDSTRSGNHGTTGGMVVADRVDGYNNMGKGLHFDGSAKYVALAGLSGDFIGGLTELTVEGLNASAIYGAQGVFLSDGVHWTENISIHFTISDGVGRSNIYTAANVSSTCTGTMSIEHGSHVATTWKGGGEHTIYIDGTKDEAVSTSGSSIKTEDNSMRIGATPYPHYDVITVSEVRISDVVRSDAWLQTTSRGLRDQLIMFEEVDKPKKLSDEPTMPGIVLPERMRK